MVNAFPVIIVKGPAEGPFGPLSAGDPVLFVSQLLLPFLVGFDDLLHRVRCYALNLHHIYEWDSGGYSFIPYSVVKSAVMGVA
jgi:hypothetical protein